MSRKSKKSMDLVVKNDEDDPKFFPVINALADEIERDYRRVCYSVNTELVKHYYENGEKICLVQDRYGWGRRVVETLSKELKRRMPGVSGLSEKNLWQMRKFYRTYHNSERLLPLVMSISWSNNDVIIDKCKDEAEREYYVRMTLTYHWSRSVLISHIKEKMYENSMNSTTNFDMTLPQEIKVPALLSVRANYDFGFLDLPDDYSEAELEKQLISNVDKLLEVFGPDYSYHGHQVSVTIGNKAHRVDILLYQLRLECYVVVELKVRKFAIEYASKMKYYLDAVNNQFYNPSGNYPLGIIICRDKDETDVRYALSMENCPLAIATYSTCATVPKEYEGMLPSPEELSKLFE
ncbi:MAG: PDDEXK nuclease domain-containing protein [Clostridia bacterium]|nr:PDDEXK nuclease domain-containing protein [Clostridia bacterium]